MLAPLIILVAVAQFAAIRLAGADAEPPPYQILENGIRLTLWKSQDEVSRKQFINVLFLYDNITEATISFDPGINLPRFRVFERKAKRDGGSRWVLLAKGQNNLAVECAYSDKVNLPPGEQVARVYPIDAWGGYKIRVGQTYMIQDEGGKLWLTYRIKPD